MRLNLVGLMIGGVGFGQAVIDALGTVIRQTSGASSTYLVKLLFALKGLTEVEVPGERVQPAVQK